MKVLRNIFAFQQNSGGSEFDELMKPIKQIINALTGGSGGSGGSGSAPRQSKGGPSKKIIFLLPIVLITVWLGSGVYVVNPGEVAIVRRFGAWDQQQIAEGLHWHVPTPVEQVDIISISRVRSMELGFRTFGETGNGQTSPDAQEARMITGDENLVDVQLVVQYQISNAGDFLFNVKDPGGTPDITTLRDATASSLRQIVGKKPIDDVLTLGKEQVQIETSLLLQSILDEYGAGIRIVNVQLQDVQPPPEVQAAFKDVISAREDKEKFINQGEAYKEDVVPRARGQAQRDIQDAEAFKFESIAAANGEAARFTSRLLEYNQAKDATERRLYIEALESVLPTIKVIVMDSATSGNVLPFLPLQEISKNETSKSGGTLE
jgi:membrane protease subunit HflK